MTKMPLTYFRPPLPMQAPHKIWLWLAKWFRRRCLNIVDDEDDGRTPELSYTIRSHMSLRLRRAKTNKNTNTDGCEKLSHSCMHSTRTDENAIQVGKQGIKPRTHSILT